MSSTIDPFHEGFESGKLEGYKEGYEKGLKSVLDRLEKVYVEDVGRPDRGSSEGEAILKLARELVVWAKGELEKI